MPLPNTLLPVANRIITPLYIDIWRQHHLNQSQVYYWLRQGFHIRFDHSSHSCKPVKHNIFHKRTYWEHYKIYLLPWTIPPEGTQPLYEIHSSSVGVIPKNTSQVDIVADLYNSSPDGVTVNDCINPNICSLHYISIQNAINEICKIGHTAQLAKINIKDAYPIITIQPYDIHFWGVASRLPKF